MNSKPDDEVKTAETASATIEEGAPVVPPPNAPATVATDAAARLEAIIADNEYLRAANQNLTSLLIKARPESKDHKDVKRALDRALLSAEKAAQQKADLALAQKRLRFVYRKMKSYLEKIKALQARRKAGRAKNFKPSLSSAGETE